MAEADIAAGIVARFEAEGATRIEPGYLQPAEVLLDLYGEDIRARAYITDDPVHGEQMLRPDFTVPVVRQHLSSGKPEARYTYAGPVWRRQSVGSTRAREFWQVGFEIFGGTPVEADADLFKLIRDESGAEAKATIGDLSLLFAAIAALKTTERRKAALRRHVWRPERFNRLLDRFAGIAPFDCDTRALPTELAGEPIGLRSPQEVRARLQRLKEERAAPDLAQEEVEIVRSLLDLTGDAESCAQLVSDLAQVCPGIAAAAARIEARNAALHARGVAPRDLGFDASLGRRLMEYYDGFVFVIGEVASGGRYDAMTRAMGGGDMPAVGGVIRPAMLGAGT